MPMDAKVLESLIRDAFPQAKIQIEDLAGDQDHYSVSIETSEFKGKTRVQQHQMVYAALQGRLGPELHALVLRTMIPLEKKI